MGFLDFLSAPLDLITKPIAAIAKTATGALGGILKPLTSTATQIAGAVTAPLTHTVDAAESLGKMGIQTYGQTMQGVTQTMGNTVQGVVQTAGGVLQPIAGGLGGLAGDVGGGISSLMSMIPYLAIGGLGLFAVMEISDKKRGGEGYMPALKRMRT